MISRVVFKSLSCVRASIALKCDGLLERVKELMEKDKIQELTVLYNLESVKINCVPVLSQGELYGRLAEGRLYRHFMAESFLPSFMKENREEKKFVALR